MPPKSIIQQTGSGQIILTLPKALAQVLEIKKGKILSFRLEKDFSFTLIKVDKKISPLEKNVQETNTGQITISIPKTLALATGFVKGTEVWFSLDEKKNLTLHK